MFFKKKISEKIPQNLLKNDAPNPQIEKEKIEKTKKKIKKEKPVWDNKFTLIHVQFPIPIEKEGLKRKYKLNITYKDKEDKIRKKTIRFGKKNVHDFVDDHDEMKKRKIINKLGNTHNLFHQNFWRFHLLNGDGKTLKENYVDLLSKIN